MRGEVGPGGTGAAIRQLWDGGTAAGLGDAELLDRFARRGDQAAFSALVTRHGALVLGVCRRVLGDEHAAEDASQAVFLVLARKAGSVSRPDRLAAWLHGVAVRTSRRAKTMTARRRSREALAASSPRQTEDSPADDLRRVIDQELARLPEKYRAPVLLCDLGGRSIDEAAGVLGWPRGTVGTRLRKARGVLKSRLTRRGVGLGAGLALAHFSGPPVSAAWVARTTQSATHYAAPGSAAAVTATPTALLADRVIRGMLMTQFKLVAALAGTVLIGGGGLLTLRAGYQGKAGDPPAAAGRPATTAAEEQEVARADDTLRLKKVGLALHMYTSANAHLPPAAVRSAEGKPLLSWRVTVLPFLNDPAATALYEKFHLDEPWDGPHNKVLLSSMPADYTPRGPSGVVGGTDIKVFVGPGATFEDGKVVTPKSITDGTSATLMAVQAGPPVPWTKPEDISFSPDKPLPKLAGPLKGGVLALMVDGSVHFVSDAVKPWTVLAGVVRNDGGGVKPADLDPTPE